MATNWAHSLFRVAAVVAALISIIGCEGPEGDEGPAGPPGPPGSSALSPAQEALARRIAETQLANGAWGFIGTWYEPIDYTFGGYQNTTGVSALGHFDAYRADLQDDGIVQEMWFVPGTLERVKDYLIQWMEDFVNGTVNPSSEDPDTLSGTVPTTVSFPNFVFCKRYEDLFGLTAGEAAIVQAAFDLLLANRDVTHGTDPAVIADGAFNRIVEVRAGIPGLTGWDVAYYVRALVDMGSPAAEIAWVVDEMKALPNLDASLSFGLLSIAHVLTVLNLTGDTSMNTTLLNAMQAERNPDGSYGTDPEGSPQTSAFCLMALKTLVLTSDAAATQAWLETQIHVGGHVYGPADNVEVYEAESEMLWSLIYLNP